MGQASAVLAARRGAGGSTLMRQIDTYVNLGTSSPSHVYQNNPAPTKAPIARHPHHPRDRCVAGVFPLAALSFRDDPRRDHHRQNCGRKQQHYGLLSLVSHGAVVFFAVPALILFTLMLLVLLYDSVVIALEVKKSFDEDEENADEGKACGTQGDDEGGGWFRNEHDPPL